MKHNPMEGRLVNDAVMTLSSRKLTQGADRCGGFIGLDARVILKPFARFGDALPLAEKVLRYDNAKGIVPVAVLTTQALKLLFQYPEGTRVGNHIRELIAKER